MNADYLIHLANYSDGVSLWLLDTIINLAPSLDLFGTIIGMFHSFSVFAKPGHARMQVTGGIADALPLHCFGLVHRHAQPADLQRLYNNQARMIPLQLDSAKTMLINRMDGQPVVTLDKQNRPNAEVVATAGAG